MPRPRVIALALLALAWLGTGWALDRYGRRAVKGQGYDAIVVAGCRVRPDGQPSLSLQRRARHAVALHRAGHAPRVVFTGGVGDHPPSEASAAASYAVAQGLPESAVVLEDRSTTTEENARFAADVIGGGHVLVVTDAFHVYRTERVFRRHFSEVDGVGSVGSPLPRLRGSLREAVAVVVYGLLGRLG